MAWYKKSLYLQKLFLYNICTVFVRFCTVFRYYKLCGFCHWLFVTQCGLGEICCVFIGRDICIPIKTTLIEKQVLQMYLQVTFNHSNWVTIFILKVFPTYYLPGTLLKKHQSNTHSPSNTPTQYSMCSESWMNQTHQSTSRPLLNMASLNTSNSQIGIW